MKENDILALKKFIVAQTIATESFECSFDSIRGIFINEIENKILLNGNRAFNKKQEKKRAELIYKFDNNAKIYIEKNNSLLKRIDSLIFIDEFDELINKSYDSLDEIIK